MAKTRTKLSFIDEDLWYLVGLIATDGNLSSDGRHVDITSKHLEFLEKIKETLGLVNKIGTKYREKGSEKYYRMQIANKNFYEFLISIGLTPNKSLSLGELKVPEKEFRDFIRGVIDGDGSIRRWMHPSNGGEQWSLRIYSASIEFMNWLKVRIEKSFFTKGRVHKNGGRTFVLKYGKLAVQRILQTCYYDGSMGMDRKARLAKDCVISGMRWRKSKTLVGKS